jgi:hypothetical protein
MGAIVERARDLDQLRELPVAERLQLVDDLSDEAVAPRA